MAERSQLVANNSDIDADWSFDPKPPEKREIWATNLPTVATIATIAGPNPQKLPWDDDLARFLAMPRPADVDAEIWDELQGEAEMTSRNWGYLAVGNGWTAMDMFGCNPEPFARRYDRNGLVITLVRFAVPLRILDITAELAVLEDPHGRQLRHRLGGRTGQVLLWEAYQSESGP